MMKINIKSCTECSDHRIINDADPWDWFCDNDCAVVCSITSNPHQNTKSKWRSDHSPHRVVASSCRPYNVEEKSEVPKWCPKRKKEKK